VAWEKDLQISGAGRKSQKTPTPVAGNKPNGKCQIMTIIEAKERRRIWKMLGNKSCNHANVELERDDIGTSTGDYVCTMCGKEGTDRDLTPPKAE
jgi:hypothetical protein